MSEDGWCTHDVDIACVELVEQVTDYLEEALPHGTVAAIQSHLTACADCSAYIQQVREAIRISRTIATASDETALDEQILRMYRSWEARVQAE